MALLNHVSETVPRDVSDLLINHIDLKYHPNLTSEEGEDVHAILDSEYSEGGCVLKEIIALTGCPPHPNTIVWPIVQIILGRSIRLDPYGRPEMLYGETIHMNCERRGRVFATGLSQEGTCLYHLGCKGPKSWGGCPSSKWNNGRSWCVESNAPCIGCTEPLFPGNKPFFKIPEV